MPTKRYIRVTDGQNARLSKAAGAPSSPPLGPAEQSPCDVSYDGDVLLAPRVLAKARRSSQVTMLCGAWRRRGVEMARQH